MRERKQKRRDRQQWIEVIELVGGPCDGMHINSAYDEDAPLIETTWPHPKTRRPVIYRRRGDSANTKVRWHDGQWYVWTMFDFVGEV